MKYRLNYEIIKEREKQKGNTHKILIETSYLVLLERKKGIGIDIHHYFLPHKLAYIAGNKYDMRLGD